MSMMININMKNKLTTKIINDMLSIRDIFMIDEFTTKNSKSWFRCSHNHKWNALVKSVISGTGCPECNLSNRRISFDEVNERISSRDIRLIGQFVSTQHKALFRCDFGHEWSSVVNLVLRGRGCKMCHFENRKFDADVINKKICDRGIKIVGKYLTSEVKTEFECKCGYVWSSKPNNILNGQGCPACVSYGFNPEKPGWVYIISFGTFIKYGITNSLKNRLSEHRRNNGDHLLIYSHLFERGKDAIEWEKRIKSELGGRFVHKELCPDGYTETLSMTLLETILNDYCKR
jgi:hypothetical protein